MLALAAFTQMKQQKNSVRFYWCSGSGSVGAISFKYSGPPFRIYTVIICTYSSLGSVHQSFHKQAKIKTKTLISTVEFFDFLIASYL